MQAFLSTYQIYALRREFKIQKNKRKSAFKAFYQVFLLDFK